MNALSAPHIISASALAAPLAVLLLASINALLDNGGQAARNAVTIAKSVLCVSVLSLIAVMVAGHLQLVLMTFGELALGLNLSLLTVSLLLAASFSSLLIAKATTIHAAADSVRGSIARWNISVLFMVCAMILSGNLVCAAIASVITVTGVLIAYTTLPSILPGFTNGGMKPLT